jgi:threonine/homoserine/homoserine lactone efflux protein
MMLEAALAGIVAGYAIAIPVGAIAVLIIHIGLLRGLRQGLAAGAGAASADGIYASAAALGGLALASVIEPLVGPLRIVAGGVLIAFGVRGFLALRGPRDALGPAARDAHAVSPGRTYLSLLGLTLLNPMTVVYFVALTIGLPFLGGLAERIVFALAALVASLSWQSLLAFVGAALGRGSGRRLRTPTVVLGSALILLMGGLILLEGLRT